MCALIAWFLTRGITRPLATAVQAAGRLAEGDLTLQIGSMAKDETGQVLQAMQNMIFKLSQVASEVKSGAQALVSASGQISATSQTLSQAASEQASSVEETSASLEQMTASIGQNTENAKVTDGMASKAATQAAEGGEAVSATVAAMKHNASSSGELAATAEEMSSQAEQLQRAVAFFTLDGAGHAKPVAISERKSTSKRGGFNGASASRLDEAQFAEV